MLRIPSIYWNEVRILTSVPLTVPALVLFGPRRLT